MFSGRLKYMRKLRKLSQEELAKKINTTKGTISNYENQYSSPSNDTLRDISRVLQTTTDFLLGESNDPRLTKEQEKEIDKKTLDLLKKLEELPEDKRDYYIGKIEAYVDGLTHAEEKGDD